MIFLANPIILLSAHDFREGDGTHSSTLAWKIPWTEEPGRLQSMQSQRVGHDWATSLSLFIFMHWRRKWQPTPVFLPGESQGRRSLVGCPLWGRTESDTTEATQQQLPSTKKQCRGRGPLPEGLGLGLDLFLLAPSPDSATSKSCWFFQGEPSASNENPKLGLRLPYL